MAKTAFIDLATRSVVIKDTAPEDLLQHLGGRGLGARLLYQQVSPDVDPLSSSNVLIFTTGLLTGTTWPANGMLLASSSRPISCPS